MKAALKLAVTAMALTAVIGWNVTSAKAAHHDEEKMDIVDTAVGAGKFKTLVAAVQAAGLVDVLKLCKEQAILVCRVDQRATMLCLGLVGVRA